MDIYVRLVQLKKKGCNHSDENTSISQVKSLPWLLQLEFTPSAKTTQLSIVQQDDYVRHESSASHFGETEAFRTKPVKYISSSILCGSNELEKIRQRRIWAHSPRDRHLISAYIVLDIHGVQSVFRVRCNPAWIWDLGLCSGLNLLQTIVDIWEIYHICLFSTCNRNWSHA